MPTITHFTHLDLAERVERILNALAIIGTSAVSSADFYFAGLRAMPGGREAMVEAMLAILARSQKLSDAQRAAASEIIWSALS